MKTERYKGWGILAAPALALLSAPAIGAPLAQQAEFDAAIGEAKSSMMADSAAALESAQRAESLVSGESKEAQEARLTAQWLKGEALMRLNRADEAAETINAALEEVPFGRKDQSCTRICGVRKPTCKSAKAITGKR